MAGMATAVRILAVPSTSALVLAAALLFGLAGAAQAAPQVTGVSMGDQGGATRLVLDISDHVAFRVFTLDNPYRVVIDLPVVDWRLDPGGDSLQLGIVAGYRHGRFDADTSRVVLDLSGPAEVARAFLLPPEGGSSYRLVLDLRPVDAETFVSGAPPPPAAAVAAAPTPVPAPAERPGRIVVAIDPGHGGIDPGTIGATGVREKEVTLAVSRELAAVLEATGRYRAVLTRTDDVFLSLRDRVASAREAGADLFVSIHADSLNTASVRGASVYTLSETASDKEAEALAAKENQADIIGGLDLAAQSSDVAAILISLAQRESMNLSAIFANMLIPEIAEQWQVVRNTHRFAGFAVLKAPDVPSVLVELGYLSNPRDEQALASPAGRRPVVDAMVRAINAYFAAYGGRAGSSSG